MTDKKKNDSSINPVAAGVAGAVIGAGVAIAGAAVLKDESNRKKISDTVNTLKDKGAEYVGDMQKEADSKKDEITEKVQAETT